MGAAALAGLRICMLQENAAILLIPSLHAASAALSGTLQTEPRIATVQVHIARQQTSLALKEGNALALTHVCFASMGAVMENASQYAPRSALETNAASLMGAAISALTLTRILLENAETR